MKQTISVLGTGWLGLPLARHFIQTGFHCKGSTTKPERLSELLQNGIEAYLIDTVERIYDPRFFICDILVLNITGKDISSYEDLVAEIEKHNIQHVIFVSSTSVYDPQQDPITEDTPTNSSALAQIEKLFLAVKGLRLTIIRFGGLIGYSRHPGNFFKDGRKIPNPEGCVNMIHRDDCILLLDHVVKNQITGIINGVSKDHRKRREYYTQMRAELGKEPPVFEEGGEVVHKVVVSKWNLPGLRD